MSKTNRIPAFHPALFLCAALSLLATSIDALGQDEDAPFFRAIGSPVVGGKLFMAKGCNTCHAIYGIGGAQGPDLGKARSASTFLDTVGVLWNHQPRMEQEYRRLNLERPSLTGFEIVDLISFVYYLGYFGDPGDAGEGELVFLRGRCVECHSVGSHGGGQGIPLDRFQSYRSPAFISSALWNGWRAISLALDRKDISLPIPAENDLTDLLAFIRRDANPEERAADVYLPPGNPGKGEGLFESKSCMKCHTPGGEGRGDAPALGSSRFSGTLSQLGVAMWNHAPTMWEAMKAENIPFPELTPEEMSDLTAFLYFSSFVDEPGDPQRGRELFAGKGCANCHDTESIEEGGMEFDGVPGVIAAMWNHLSLMDDAVRSENIAWPEFQPGEMAHLVAYLQSR